MRTSTFRAVIVAVVLAVVIGCGGGADPTATSVPPIAPPEPTSTLVPAASPIKTPRPVAEPVVPAVEPEPGSDEAAVLKVLENVTMSYRNEDFALFQSLCNPSNAVLRLDQVEFLFESVFSPFGDLAGINHRDVTVRLFKDDTAITESIMYEFDDVLFSSYSYSFSKVDGNWYLDSFC